MNDKPSVSNTQMKRSRRPGNIKSPFRGQLNKGVILHPCANDIGDGVASVCAQRCKLGWLTLNELCSNPDADSAMIESEGK